MRTLQCKAQGLPELQKQGQAQMHQLPSTTPQLQDGGVAVRI
jgi:hypothetical protein